jgi:predicted RNase H-like nuclease (RuvC/YqgF family)
MQLIMKDLEDIEMKKISGKVEDKKEEIRRLQKQIVEDKNITQENKDELRDFHDELQALKNEL